MDVNWIIINFLRLVFLIVGPVSLMLGIFLLFDLNSYLRLEQILSRSYVYTKQASVNILEKNRQTFYNMVLKKPRFFGCLCLIFALISIFISSFFSRQLLVKLVLDV